MKFTLQTDVTKTGAESCLVTSQEAVTDFTLNKWAKKWQISQATRGQMLTQVS